MAGEKDAKIEKARQLAESGKFTQAIDAWQLLLDGTPSNDANVCNTIGDLCLKNKATPDAIDAYSKAARCYLQEGFHLKAVALYKKILKLDPNRAEVHALLGDLNVVRGLMNNAVADYLSGAKTYLKIGKAMNALTLFRKITRADPQNFELRLRVAELCCKENLTEEAIEEYLRVGREYQRLGRAEEAGKLYEQILKICPGHPEARRRLDNPLEPVADSPEQAVAAAEELTVEDVLQSTAALEVQAASEPVPAEAVASADEHSPDGLAGSIEFNVEGIEVEPLAASSSTPAESQAVNAPVLEAETPQPASAAVEPPPTLEETRRILAAGQVEKAERMIRILLLEEPDRKEYQAVLGIIYLKKGHAAIAHDMLYPLAQSWLEEGRCEETVEIIEAFLAIEPDDAEFLALQAESKGISVEAVETVPGECKVEGLELEVPTASPVPLAVEQEARAPVMEVEMEAPSLNFAEPAPAVAKEIVSGKILKSSADDDSSQATGDEFEAIFDQVSKGADEQPTDEKFETHYDLGVAYKEMGLLVEAIEEFQLAMRGSTRFIESCAMLAACYKSQNKSASAIAFLERVLADARCEGPGALRVKYDLAALYEEEGFTDKAVRLYEEIPSMRDAETRLQKLRGAGEPMAPPPAGTKRPVSYL